MLVWRTNLDSRLYRDVLRGHSRRCTADLSPRLAHLHPTVAHLRQPQAAPIEVSPRAETSLNRLGLTIRVYGEQLRRMILL